MCVGRAGLHAHQRLGRRPLWEPAGNLVRRKGPEPCATCAVHRGRLRLARSFRNGPQGERATLTTFLRSARCQTSSSSPLLFPRNAFTLLTHVMRGPRVTGSPDAPTQEGQHEPRPEVTALPKRGLRETQAWRRTGGAAPAPHLYCPTARGQRTQ